MSSTWKGSNPATVAKNLVQNLGLEGANEFVDRIISGESFASLGPDFNLSRERVRQIAIILGVRQKIYRVDEEIARLLTEAEKAGIRRAGAVVP